MKTATKYLILGGLAGWFLKRAYDGPYGQAAKAWALNKIAPKQEKTAKKDKDTDFEDVD